MPIEVSYEAGLDALMIQCTGTVVYKDMPVLGNQILSHPDFRKNISQIFDVTQGVLELSTEDLKQVATDFSQIAKILGMNRKLALVVSRDVDFGMMRMYEVFFQPGPHVKIMSFRSMDKAKQWIAPDA